MSTIFKALLLGAALCSNAAHAINAYDWKLYGLTDLKQQDGLFYLNNEIVRRPGYVQVWIKALRMDKINAVDPAKHKDMINKTIKLVKSAYFPPLTTEQDISSEFVTALTLWEQIADENNIHPTITMLYELDCTRKKSRYLAITGVKGSLDVNEASEWEYIPPDTNPDTLRKLTCN